MGLGLLPAPTVYGFVNESFPVPITLPNNEIANASRAGMRVTFFSSVLGAFALAFALLLRKRSVEKDVIGIRNSLVDFHPGMTVAEIQKLSGRRPQTIGATTYDEVSNFELRTD